jgi:hypothetical protein
MTKWHLGVGPIVRHRIYYKGEGGGGFPQVRCKKKKFPIQQQEQQYVVPFVCTLYILPQVQDSNDNT